MILIKEIAEIPELEWAHPSQTLVEDDFKNNLQLYQLGNAGVLGIVYSSLISPPWIWFRLSKSFSNRDLIELKKESYRLPRDAHTVVKTTFKEGERFARFFGFEPQHTLIDYDGDVYEIYRRV